MADSQHIEEIRTRFNSGEKLKFLFFWGHQPGKNGIWGSKPKPAEFSDSQKLPRQNGFQVNRVALASEWGCTPEPPKFPPHGYLII